MQMCFQKNFASFSNFKNISCVVDINNLKSIQESLAQTGRWTARLIANAPKKARPYIHRAIILFAKGASTLCGRITFI